MKILPINELFIEITNKCLLQCKHCSSEASSISQDFLSLQELQTLIKETIPYGLKHLALSGGEPLLHNDILKILEFASKNAISSCLYTCGIILKESNLIPIPPQLLKNLRNAGLQTLIFSLHGVTEQVHDSITCVPGSFSLGSIAIRNAVDLGFNVEVHCVPMKPNAEQCLKLIDFVGALGVKRVSFLRLVPQGRASKNYRELHLGGSEAVYLWKVITNYHNKYGVQVRFGTPFNCIKIEPGSTMCTAGRNKLLISPTGEVFPCEAFKYNKGKRPTIRNRPVLEIWHHDELLRNLRTITYQDIKICSTCEFIFACGGGCPGQRLLTNGDLEIGPDPWCTTKEALLSL